MTYTKPNLFELGNARNLVLGDQVVPYLELDQTLNSTPVVACDDPPGTFESIEGCIQ